MVKKKHNNPHYASWLTIKQEQNLVVEWGKIQDRFLNSVEKLQQKYGGKERIKVIAKDGNIEDMVVELKEVDQ